MIVLDDTTAVLIASHPVLAELAVNAPRDARDRIVVPALCLVPALAEGLSQSFVDGLGSLHGADLAPLDFQSFHHVVELTGLGVPWPRAHAVHLIQAAGPSAADWADYVIVTTDSKAYEGLGLAVLDLHDL